MSSFKRVAARLLILRKILSCTSESTAFSALANSVVSTSRSTFWMARSSKSTISSNTNIRFLISSASSGSSSSNRSIMPFSVERSTRLRISTMLSTPPAAV